MIALVLIPAAASLLLALWPRQAERLNVAAAALTLAVAAWLATQPYPASGWLRVDALNLPLILVAAVVGLGTAIFSAQDVVHERFGPRAHRAYHAAFQLFCAANFLALLSDNLGVMWVAIEAATLATVLMVALHRTPSATEAAWKFFLLCGVGIALALLGIVVLALAAQPHLPQAGGGGHATLSFALLREAAPRADAGLLNLAFVLLLVGFGTKAGLVPLHSWLPDAHAEGPTPIAAVLSGLLLNAAMHGILRGQAIVGANASVIPPGHLLLALGLASLLVAALALWRRRDAKRLFGWSSIEHMGLAAIAFGIGAHAAGLLHLVGHSLLKSAVFSAIGRAARLKGSQALADIGGLCVSHPALGWGLALAVAGIAGMPPFVLFLSEVQTALEAGRAAPWVLVPLLTGLLVAATALILALQNLCFGAPTPPAPGMEGASAGAGTLVPLWGHLALCLVVALALPAPLAGVFAEAARMFAR
ncbi:MAG: hydrogenase 4 subunit F, partial [Acetobacteraceae bacterium]|nr:hydrogenase 4 subunit F [Acetobacteraceae bacterium]